MVVTSCDRYDRKLGDVTVVRGDEFQPTEPRVESLDPAA